MPYYTKSGLVTPLEMRGQTDVLPTGLQDIISLPQPVYACVEVMF